jgi:uncharacterized Zn finger protein/predicted transcriptional regulator of viral defense system
MSYFRYPRYISVAEKRAKAEKKIKQLLKKQPDLKPVRINGNVLAKTWWGKAWNKNLESYADYTNRIGRGRSYVRHGAVLDLKIEPGEVRALVSGSLATPYTVRFNIAGIKPTAWKKIAAGCRHKIDSMQKLLAGEFPQALEEIFTTQKTGLFPAPAQIKFECSCPDWAYMCKHVAAVLYGIGARLDEDPLLFFTLRKVDVDQLVSGAVADSKKKLLKKAAKKSTRVLDNANLSELFGIDLDDDLDLKHNDLKPAKKTSARVKRAKLPAARASRAIKKPQSKKGPSALSVVAQVVAQNPGGIGFHALKQQTGLNENKIRNSIYRLKKQGKIATPRRGIYVAGRPRPAKSKTKKASTLRLVTPAQKRPPSADTAIGLVAGIINQHPRGISTIELKKKTGLDDKKIHNVLFRLKMLGRIKHVSRGVYAGLETKKTTLKKSSVKPKAKLPAIEQLAAIVRRSRKGIGIPTLVAKTGFDQRTVNSLLFRLNKQGRIIKIARGIYKGA